MIGKNKMILNQETICEALEFYLNEKDFKVCSPVRVVDVESSLLYVNNQPTYTYTVTVIGREPARTDEDAPANPEAREGGR